MSSPFNPDHGYPHAPTLKHAKAVLLQHGWRVRRAPYKQVTTSKGDAEFLGYEGDVCYQALRLAEGKGI